MRGPVYRLPAESNFRAVYRPDLTERSTMCVPRVLTRHDINITDRKI